MVKDWLVKRLTPKKAQQARWVGLASSRQKVWETFFDPDLLRLENLRSFYKAHDEDLALLLREMGDYFSSDAPNQADRPISVAWRRLELEYKDLELILSSVFRRHFGNLPTTWFPLFAPLDEEYGMTFIAAEGPWPELKNVPPEGMWLTSRGMLGTDYGHLLKYGYSKAEFLERAVPLLKRTKPLHIVYDGPLFYIRFDIPVEFDFSVFWERDEWYALPFRTVIPRFDFVPADAHHLDLLSSMFCEWEREDSQSMPFLGNQYQRAWHLDWHVPEGFPPDWLPLDYLISGVEGENAAPFRLYLLDVTDSPVIEAAPASLAAGGETLLKHCPLYGSADIAMRGEVADTTVIPFLPEKSWHLDTRFSPSVPEGWLPQDWLFTGREGEPISRLALYLGETSAFPVLSVDMRLSRSVEQDNAPVSAPFRAAVSGRTEPLIPLSVLYAGRKDRIDTYPQFDQVPADFCPLDMPVGGAYV